MIVSKSQLTRKCRLIGTYPHDAQLDYFRFTPPNALHTDSIPKQLHSVFRFRINSVQCRSRSFDEAHHGAAGEFGLRGSVCPDLVYKPRCSPRPRSDDHALPSHGRELGFGPSIALPADRVSAGELRSKVRSSP